MLVQLSYVVAAGGNTSGVACSLAQPGFCISLLLLLQDASMVATFNQTLEGWVCSGSFLPLSSPKLIHATMLYDHRAERLSTCGCLLTDGLSALCVQNASGNGVLPPAAASLAGAFKDTAEQLGTRLTSAVSPPSLPIVLV